MLESGRPFVLRTETSAVCGAPPEVVFDVITDLRAHLIWSGERAEDKTFKLLALEGPDGPAIVGTEFTSTGANFNGTFRDRSVVTEANRPTSFVISTNSHLDRKRGKPWDVHFEHRYTITAEGTGSKIVYTETIDRVSYVPYWLKCWIRPISIPLINSGDRKQLANLARLAEERAGL